MLINAGTILITTQYQPPRSSFSIRHNLPICHYKPSDIVCPSPLDPNGNHKVTIPSRVGFDVLGRGFDVLGLGFDVLGLGYEALGLGYEALGVGLGFGARVRSLGTRVRSFEI